MGFKRSQLAAAFADLGAQELNINGANVKIAVSGPHEPQWLFLARIFDLDWDDREYAEVVTGLINPNKMFLMADSAGLVEGIYDAHVRVVEGNGEKHWYFYEISK